MTTPSVQNTPIPTTPIFTDDPEPSSLPPPRSRDDFFDALGFFGDPSPATSKEPRPLPDCFLDE